MVNDLGECTATNRWFFYEALKIKLWCRYLIYNADTHVIILTACSSKTNDSVVHVIEIVHVILSSNM